jgi:Ala-tRNA(Pro) deacylase
MSLIPKLQEYLDAEGVKYTTLSHSAAFTAQELAAMLHVAGKELAKTVIVKVDGQFAMVVLPASHRIDFRCLSTALGGKEVKLAAEREFANLFPTCEVGAMPPFGNLFELPVYVAQPLTEDEEIVFNSGSFATALRMRYADYARLVRPTVVDVSELAR